MTLNFNCQTQLMDHWCWAAVASSIATFYDAGTFWTQGTLAGKFVDSQCSAIRTKQDAAGLPDCDKINDLSAVLSTIGNKAWQQPGALTLQQIQGQIMQGWPLCCEINWPVSDMSHFITIYGFNGNTLAIGDPDSGMHPFDYYALVGGQYRNGNWINTIGTTPNSINH